MNSVTVYLVPSPLSEDGYLHQLLITNTLQILKTCKALFVENEKTTRRFLKKADRNFAIDNYKWHTIHKAEEEVKKIFISYLKGGNNVAIISEAGCPGIADPGQILVEAAHTINAIIKPLIGPNSILLALMASGMNGQRFQFLGYLPIDAAERKKAIKEAEAYSHKQNCTQIFIETPYRNNAIIKDVIQTCNRQTSFCIAVNLTAETEKIQTKTIEQWQHQIPDINKQPAIFLLYAGA